MVGPLKTHTMQRKSPSDEPVTAAVGGQLDNEDEEEDKEHEADLQAEIGGITMG